MKIDKKNNNKLTSFYKLVFCLLSLLVIMGCPRKWYISIIDISDPSYPHICISRSENCSGSGLSFSSLAFWEVNEEGRNLRKVWNIVPVENEKISEIIYGVPPKGYKQTMTAIPLELDHFYTVNGAFYFRIYEEDTIKYEVFSLSEFVNK